MVLFVFEKDASGCHIRNRLCVCVHACAHVKGMREGVLKRGHWKVS